MDKSNPEVFDHVNVYGDIINSNIHHNCKFLHDPLVVSYEVHMASTADSILLFGC